MANLKRIPRPLSQRWRSFCQSVLPIVGFVGSGLLVAWLWSGQGVYTSFPGELLAPQVDATTQVVGKLIPLPNGVELTEFKRVFRGQLIGQLDPALLEAERATLVAKIEEFRAEIQSVRSTVQYTDHVAKQTFTRDQADMFEHLSMLEVKLSDTEAIQILASVNYQQFKAQLAIEKPLLEKGLVSKYFVLELERKVAEWKAQIETSRQTIKTIKKKIADATRRVDEKPMLQQAVDHVDDLLDPYRERITIQKKMIDEVNQRLKSLKIYATIDGVITAVHKKPGQAVQAGDPIVTIAATESPYVICYIRTDRTRRPDNGWENLEVDIRFPTSHHGTITGYIEKVGPKVGPIAQMQLFDPQQPEFGLPVAIRIDWDKPQFRHLKQIIQPKPGELVYINFKEVRRESPPPPAAKVTFSNGGDVRLSQFGER